MRPSLRTSVLVGLSIVLSGCVVFADDVDDRSASICAAPTDADRTTAVVEAIGWMRRGLGADGRFTYEYDRDLDLIATDYNDVRHAGTLMSLYQAAAVGFDEALPVADRALEYVLARVVRVDDRAAFLGAGPNAELGSTALVVAALVHRRIASGDTRFDDLLGQLGRFMLTQQRDDGAMLARATSATLAPIGGQTSTFYTGEAFWAFGLLASQFDDVGWRQAAAGVGRYIATARDREEGIAEPPLADQWAAYGFARLGSLQPLDVAEVAYLEALSERYLGRLEREILRENRRLGDGMGSPDESLPQARGAAFGTTVEALASLLQVAEGTAALVDLTPALHDAAVCGAAISIARQYDASRARRWPRPALVRGAWFDDDVTRVDDQQHSMSGIILAASGFDAQAG